MPDTPGEDPENVLDAELVPPAAPEPVPVAPEDTGYTDSGVPTFESVRDKIENRFGTALGSAELDADSPEGRSVEEQYEARQRAAAERLAQIRAQMKSDDR